MRMYPLFADNLLLHHFALSGTLHQSLFQQTYFLLLWWLTIAQAPYQNMGKSCEEIYRQGKKIHNSQKLWKVAAEKSFSKQTSFFQEDSVLKIQIKRHWTDLFSLNVSDVNLSYNNNRRECFQTITVCSWCWTHLTLFLLGVSRSAHSWLL